MGKSKIDSIMSGISPQEKKRILNSLVFSLISDLNESEKKEMIRNVLSGRKEGEHLESMVEY